MLGFMHSIALVNVHLLIHTLLVNQRHQSDHAGEQDSHSHAGAQKCIKHTFS